MDIPAYKPPALSDLSFSETTTTALKKDVRLAMKLATVARDLHQLRLDARQFQSDLLPYYVDRTVGYKEGAYHNLVESRKALEDAKTPAGILVVAARNLLGPGMAAWDPDTLHVELDSREKLNVPLVNYDKLLAALTLLETPAFYFEANTFQNTVLCFNHELSDPEVLSEPSPAQLCWAVYEAELILQEHMQFEPEFDLEPVQYTACVLHRSGMRMAPPLLAFAQDQLTKINIGEGLAVSEVREAWDKLDKSSLASQTFEETPMGAQLASLAACHLHVHEFADEYAKRLKALSRAP